MFTETVKFVYLRRHFHVNLPRLSAPAAYQLSIPSASSFGNAIFGTLLSYSTSISFARLPYFCLQNQSLSKFNK